MMEVRKIMVGSEGNGNEDYLLEKVPCMHWGTQCP